MRVSCKMKGREGDDMRGAITMKKITLTILGSMICALGIILMALGTLGVDTLSSFMIGIATKTNLPFGVVNGMVNFTIIAFVYIQKPNIIGIGSILNALVIASTIYLGLPLVRLVIIHVPLYEYLVLFIGPILIGIGASLYVYVALGAAALESLTLLFCDRYKNMTTRSVRMALDFIFASLGFIIGGPVGVGTLTCVLLVGPTIHKMNTVLHRKSLVIKTNAT